MLQRVMSDTCRTLPIGIINNHTERVLTRVHTPDEPEALTLRATSAVVTDRRTFQNNSSPLSA